MDVLTACLKLHYYDQPPPLMDDIVLKTVSLKA